jgi:hypothetical protein
MICQPVSTETGQPQNLRMSFPRNQLPDFAGGAVM